MKLKVASLKNPRTRIEQGDWITYPFWRTEDGSTPVRFNVSGLSSPAYRSAAEDLMKELARKYKDFPVPPDVLYAKNGELFAEHILHGWEGLDEDFSPELAEQWLTDRDYEAISDAIVWCAKKLESVTAEFVEDAIKNSEVPSVIN